MKEEIKKFFAGDVEDSAEALDKYSHDASLFEVRPQLVLFPKNVDDIKKLVSFVNTKRGEHPKLSLTGRSAGTDMSGGPLSESLVLDFTRYFTHEEVDVRALRAVVEPGVFYRNFETVTLPAHVSLPVYPASKQMAALGGMIMNNSAGEKTLRYGQVRDFVQQLSMVLADGNEYHFKKINRVELNAKMGKPGFEGDLYRKMYTLVTEYAETIAAATPQTSKNSSGYALWRVWDQMHDTFDLTQLFTGSQGTLGLLTRATLRLMPEMPERALIAVFFKSWDELPRVVNAVLPHEPESMEAFDDATLKLGMRFMPEIAARAHQNFFSFLLRFIPEALVGLRMMRLPKLIVLIEVAEEARSERDRKVRAISEALSAFAVQVRVLSDGPDSEKYWVMRRESFNLLRQHVHGKQTAPFIDDFAIDPKKMPEFLPQLLAILKKNGIVANIAGHAGNGNYHIIPLMDLSKESERAKIIPVAEEVYRLIIRYGGSITAEHNDGIIRTPFVKDMFGEPMYTLFEEVKNIFDPQNIFNPGKKVGGSIEYAREHIKKPQKV